MSDKPLDQITEADLQALVTEAEVERKTLDFKADIQRRTDSEKREFLYDVSSFANAAGGQLIFGIEEQNGRATNLVGVVIENPDAEILALESIARDGIRPPIALESKAIRLSNGNSVIVMRIAKSWNPPHQVTYNKAFRFYGRGSNGKYLLDVDELRSVFQLGSTASERIRNFRIERLSKIQASEAPVALDAGARLITHLLPLSAFLGTAIVDLRSFPDAMGELVHVIGGIREAHFNLDGFVGESNHRYIQVFRNGCIEAAQGFHDGVGSRRGYSELPSVNLEDIIIQHVKGGKRLMQFLNVEPPVLLACSLLGVKGWELAQPFGRSRSFDRDAVILPDILLPSLGSAAVQDVRPVIDTIWQAVGVRQSNSFDANGNFLRTQF